MKPITYYQNLTVAQRRAYAERAGTTLMYLVSHIYRLKGSTRIPKHELLINLAIASEGEVSIDEAIDYFHVRPIKALYAEMQSDVPVAVDVTESMAAGKVLEMNVLNEPEKAILCDSF